MGCPNFSWQHPSVLEIWREKQDNNGDSKIVLDSNPAMESIDIFKEALKDNTVRKTNFFLSDVYALLVTDVIY